MKTIIRALAVCLVMVCLLAMLPANNPVAAISQSSGKAYSQSGYDTLPAGKIAFRSESDEGWHEIFIINADGSNRTQLTNDGDTKDNREPSISRDGSKIVYSEYGTGQIWEINADGTGQKQLTDPPSGKDYHPSWSPDGTKIIFQSTRNIYNYLYIMDEDGSNLSHIDSNEMPVGDCQWPSFNNDASRIAFFSNDAGKICTAMTDGTDVQQINTTGIPNHPVWSSDGSKIAFCESSPYPIYTIDPDGSNQTNIGNGTDPAWSPDSNYIAYCSGGISVMDVSGTSTADLSDNPYDCEPSWGAGSVTPSPVTYIITTSVPGGNGTAEADPTQVASGGSSTITITPSGGYHLSALTDNNTDVLGLVSNDTFNIDNITADHIIVAAFAANAPLLLNTVTLQPGIMGTAYSQTLSASGGSGSYTWTQIDGDLPDGLTLSTDGIISGTPTAAGRFNFIVQVSDGTGTISQALIIMINGQGSVYAWGGGGVWGNSPVSINFDHVVSVAADSSNNCLALKDDGTVWTWTDNNAPTQVSGLNNVRAISSGYGFYLALDSAGNVWSWGNNYYGTLGNGSTTTNQTPGKVKINSSTYLSDIMSISAGAYNAMALDSSGKVWTWGSYSSNTATQMNTINNIIAIDAGGADQKGYDHSLALDSSGNVYAWGANNYGQIGKDPASSTLVNRYGTYYRFEWAPYLVSFNSPVVAISAGGGFSLALDDHGNVWTWGTNGDGQLGNNFSMDSFTPVEVVSDTSNALLSNITRIFASKGEYGDFSLALDSFGKAWSWGHNVNGQLGLGDRDGRLYANQIPSFSEVIAITCGSYIGLAISNASPAVPYTITTSVPGGNGTAVANPTEVNPGGSATVALTPADGYSLSALTDNDVDVLNQVSSGTYTINNITSDHTIVAVFAVNIITKLDTTISISSSLNPSTYGQSVTFTAMVTSSSGTPTGLVTFRDSEITLGTGTLDGSGETTYLTPILDAGDHSITAVYDSDNVYNGSISPPITQIVNKGTFLFSNLSSPTVTQGTASVTLSGKLSKGNYYPSGETVSITLNGVNNNTIIGTAGFFSSTFDISSLTVSSSPYTINYSYAGNANYDPTDETGSLTVNSNITPVYYYPIATLSNVSINIAEKITVSDSGMVTPPAVINIAEVIGSTDSAQSLPSGLLNLAETITVNDQSAANQNLSQDSQGGVDPARSIPGPINFIFSPNITMNEAGYTQDSTWFQTPDGQVSVDIPQGTRLLDSTGHSLSGIDVDAINKPPSPPPGDVTILAYSFNPPGATFDPPLTVTFKYPATLPSGVNAGSLFIAYFNGTQWLHLESHVDQVTHTITARISHFSMFAVFGLITPESALTTSSVDSGFLVWIIIVILLGGMAVIGLVVLLVKRMRRY